MFDCLSVCPFLRMEQLGAHWRYFHEILYMSVFRKSVEKIQSSLKSDENNEYFTWSSMCTYGIISLNSL
jgi:hypothetical protein